MQIKQRMLLKNILILKENFFSQSSEVVFRSLTEVIKIVGKKYYAVRGKKIDKIILKIQKDNLIEKAIFENRDYVVNETLAVDLILVESINEGVEIKFDNINTKLSIHKNN